MNNLLTSNYKLGIITYDSRHLKTEQIVFGLKEYLDFANVTLKIYGLPFISRPSRSPIFLHRPDQFCASSTREMAKFLNAEFIPCTYESFDSDCDLFLITGGGILPASFIHNKKIINAHPGIIPSSRGLDSFKWAIHNQTPLGITIHFVDKEVDAGEVLFIQHTPVFQSDTLNILARRHYEMEIKALLNFPKYISNLPPLYNYPILPPTRRMPINLEHTLVDSFNLYKDRFSIK